MTETLNLADHPAASKVVRQPKANGADYTQARPTQTIMPEVPLNDKTRDEILANSSKRPFYAAVVAASPANIAIFSADDKLIMHFHKIEHKQFPMGNWEWDLRLVLNSSEIIASLEDEISKLQQRVKELEDGNNG